jgi:NAD-dependent deacetylase
MLTRSARASSDGHFRYNPAVDSALAELVYELGPGASVSVVTGAGISAASGIPTFRGPEGYWTVGAKEYHPQEMATQAMFSREPKEVWRWYLYRFGVCRAAQPNAGHAALVELEEALGDDFWLLTQNVDGLHLRAGNTAARTFEVHGNIDYRRCTRPCSDELLFLPRRFHDWPKERELDDKSLAALNCPKCGAMGRPHVLWFDEFYEEGLYRFKSGLRGVAESDLLIYIGCSGAANLPLMAAREASYAGAAIVDINPEDNPFAQIATESARGHWVKANADEALPELVEALLARRRAS